MAFTLEGCHLCISSYIIKSAQGIISERQGRPIIILDYIVKRARPLFKVERWLLNIAFVHIHQQWRSIKDKTGHKKLTVAWEYAA